MELQENYAAFQALDAEIIAVAQEDTDLTSHSKFLEKGFENRRFEIVADLERTDTKRYERPSAYLIGSDGTVKQVFPALIRYRPAWETILRETKRQVGTTN